MSRFLKGCYIDLLRAQFNNGHLSIEEIKTCLGSDFGQAWPTLQKKFKQDEKGLFFNERHEREKLKRQKFSESRKANIKKRYEKTTSVDTSVLHMNLHMENENRNRDNSIGGMGEKEEGKSEKITEPLKKEIIKMDDYAKHPVDDLCRSYITGPEYQAVREAICFKNRVTMDQVTSRAKEFTMHLKSTGKLQTTMRDYMTHFSNWMNTKPVSEPVEAEPKRKTSEELLKKMGY